MMYFREPDGERRAERDAQLLLAVANPARMQIILLTSQKEWSVNSLASELGMTQSAISQHLAVLRASKAVDVRHAAQSRYYSCRSTAIAKLLNALGIAVEPEYAE